MRKLPVSPRKIISLVRDVRKLAESARRVALIGSEPGAMDAVKAALVGDAAVRAASTLLDTILLENGAAVLPGRLNGSTGLAVVVASGSELASGQLTERLKNIDAKGIPAVLVLSEAPGIELAFPFAGVGPKRVVGVGPGGTVPADVLAGAVVDAAGDGAVALAAELPALRQEACRQLIRKTSRQNAVVGALFFLPGADMPVMTMNQAKMVLKIAAAHGEQVSTDRALELLSIVGAGFGFRAAARQALDLLPGPGWVVKGGIAYGGTQAVGRAAQAYFHGDARVTPAKLEPLASRLRHPR
ncbi:MAG: DUF697 domain-containing protein [Actinobacteria bacterium]|nr:DUF697 domain-containing protein [Actinomycetota bacterium]